MRLEKRRSKLCKRIGTWSCATLTAVLFLLAAPGCSKAEEQNQADPNGFARSSRDGAPSARASERPAPAPASKTATSEPAPASLPAPQVDPKAPTVDEKHAGLASAALVHARLADLPESVLLRTGDILIAQKDIDAEIAKAPEAVREQLRKNAFFLLEQMATQKLLLQEARKADTNSDDERTMLQSYFRGLVKDAKVSDQEIAEFYEQNRDMVGEATLEQISQQIRQYLLQQKQQEIVDQHIRTMARRTPVVVSAAWVDAQAKLAGDNPVDKARTSGKPSLISFGADTCVPCQMMVPTRAAVSKKYKGKANVVYVHVGKEQILASRFGVQGIPMLLFFDAEGREFHRHTGVMSQEQIEEQFKRMGVKE